MSGPAVVLFVVGTLFGGGALALVWRSRRFLATAVRVDGTVTALVLHRSSSSPQADEAGHIRVSYHPKVRITVDGRPHVFEDTAGAASAPYAVGDTVPVLYPPGDPGRAQVDNWTNRWLGPLVLGAFAVVTLGFGWLIR